MHFRLIVEILPSVNILIASLLEIHVVHLFVGLRSESKLLEFSCLALSLQPLDFVGVSMGVVGVKQNAHNIYIFVLSEQL